MKCPDCGENIKAVPGIYTARQALGIHIALTHIPVFKEVSELKKGGEQWQGKQKLEP